MTNFEKWKETLKVEDVSVISTALCTYFMDTDSDCKDICPCYCFCKSVSKTGKAVDARELFSSDSDDDYDCSSVVSAWAKQEGEEMTKQEEIETLKGFIPSNSYNDAKATRAMCALMRARDRIAKDDKLKYYADIEQTELVVNGYRVLRLSTNKHTVHAVIIALGEDSFVKFKAVVDLKEPRGTISAGYVNDENASTIYIHIAGELFPERYE